MKFSTPNSMAGKPADPKFHLNPKRAAGEVDPVDACCLEALPRVLRETHSRSGWLVLLSDDGTEARALYHGHGSKAERQDPPRLEPEWSIAVQNGIAQTISNRNPITRRVVVPFFQGDDPVLVLVVAGRLIPYGAGDIARIALFGKEIWGELERQRYISRLEQAYEMTIHGWARSLEERERPAVSGHYQQAAMWAAELGRAMNLSEESVNHLRRGAVLHDIGKMSIPENILHKSGPLTPEEWAVVRRHPILGAEMVADALFLAEARDVILYHHERWDGKGYPYGLKADAIPLIARIFSVIDVFEALIVDRPYSTAWPRDMALAYIRQEAGQQFDPQVVEKFLEIAHTLRMS